MKSSTKLALISSLVILIGCNNTSDKNNVSKNIIEPTVKDELIVDYGNMVFYFNSTGSNFGKSLSKKLEEKPGWEVSAIALNNNESFSRPAGYFVIFKEKQKPLLNE